VLRSVSALSLCPCVEDSSSTTSMTAFLVVGLIALVVAALVRKMETPPEQRGKDAGT
jgi:hypothetical protein